MSFGGFGYGEDPQNRKERRTQGKKERRKDEKRQSKKDKKKNSSKGTKQKWRRLDDGGIAFGNSFKIGRGGLIGFGVIGFVALFMATGLTLYPIDSEQDGGQCANPFCEWIDILTGADEYGAKQTPKEQVPMEDRDFLPPSEFLIPFAEARSDEEPCYASPEKCAEIGKETENMWNKDKGAGEQNPNKEKDSDERNLDVKLKKDEVDRLKLKLDENEEKLREKIMERSEEINDRNQFSSQLKTLEREYEDIEDEWRHEKDKYQRTDEEKNTFNELERQYNEKKRQYERVLFDYERASNNVERIDDEIEDLKERIRIDELYLPVILDELDELKFKANIIHRDYQFFSIILSKTCMKMIEGGFNEKKTALVDETGWVYGEIVEEKCPTYRELVAVFDNTVPFVSGEFVENDSGTDIKREHSNYKKYWQYYQQLGNWKVIAVDPDAEWEKRSITITIEPRNFTYAEKLGSNDKTESYTPFINNVNGTWQEPKITSFDGVRVYDKCSGARVAPDVELIAETINFFLEECDPALNPRTEYTTMLDYFDPLQARLNSEFTAYKNWLTEMMETCLVKC